MKQLSFTIIGVIASFILYKPIVISYYSKFVIEKT
nr:hypothetical protein BN993_01280 [Virgibacillus halodenitrificans]